MTDSRDWTGRVGAKWADQWRRTDRSFGELTPRLLASALSDPFTYALDIGCGAGELTCALAGAHASAHVTGLDISADLLNAARSRCDTLANTAFAHADAASFKPLHAPNLLVSRHGVMFFAEPVAAFAHLLAEASPGARLVFSCFRSRGHNEWATATIGVLDDPPDSPADPAAPGPFAFADHDRTARILSDAGWSGLSFDPIDYRMILGGGEHPVSDAMDYLMHIGPLAPAMAELPDAKRRAALERLGQLLEDNRIADTVSLPASAWIVTARSH